MSDLALLVNLLVLLGIADGAPVFAKKLFGDRFATPLDGGDDLAFELCSYFPWLDGPGHAGVEDLDAVEAAADEDGLEA